MSKVTNLAVIRDCLFRLEKLTRDEITKSVEGVNIDIKSEDKFSLGVADVVALCRQARVLIDDLGANDISEKEIDRIKTKNKIQHIMENIDCELEKLRSLLEEDNRGFVSIFTSKVQNISDENVVSGKKHELHNLRLMFDDIRMLFDKENIETIETESIDKVKHETVKSALKYGPATTYSSTGAVEFTKDESHEAALESINEKEKLLEKNIEMLIVGARSLADFGRNLHEELETQTGMLLGSSDKVSSSGEKLGSLKKRVDKIISERFSQSIFLSVLFMLIFLGLVAYLLYEILTFRS